MVLQPPLGVRVQIADVLERLTEPQQCRLRVVGHQGRFPLLEQRHPRARLGPDAHRRQRLPLRRRQRRTGGDGLLLGGLDVAGPVAARVVHRAIGAAVEAVAGSRGHRLRLHHPTAVRRLAAQRRDVIQQRLGLLIVGAELDAGPLGLQGQPLRLVQVPPAEQAVGLFHQHLGVVAPPHFGAGSFGPLRNDLGITGDERVDAVRIIVGGTVLGVSGAGLLDEVLGAAERRPRPGPGERSAAVLRDWLDSNRPAALRRARRGLRPAGRGSAGAALRGRWAEGNDAPSGPHAADRGGGEADVRGELLRRVLVRSEHGRVLQRLAVPVDGAFHFALRTLPGPKEALLGLALGIAGNGGGRADSSGPLTLRVDPREPLVQARSVLADARLVRRCDRSAGDRLGRCPQDRLPRATAMKPGSILAVVFNTRFSFRDSQSSLAVWTGCRSGVPRGCRGPGHDLRGEQGGLFRRRMPGVTAAADRPPTNHRRRLAAMGSRDSVDESGINTGRQTTGQGQFSPICRTAGVFSPPAPRSAPGLGPRGAEIYTRWAEQGPLSPCPSSSSPRDPSCPSRHPWAAFFEVRGPRGRLGFSFHAGAPLSPRASAGCPCPPPAAE